MVSRSLFTPIILTDEFKASLEMMYNAGFPQCTRICASVSVLICMNNIIKYSSIKL